MVGHVFFQGVALAVADDGHRLAMEQAHAAVNGAVIHAAAVAPLLKEIGKQGGDELRGARPLRIAGQGHPLGGLQLICHGCPLLFHAV